MPLIWCAISGHGYGHAAQVVPVLNELVRRIPGLTALLRTTVPAAFFEGRLDLPWELSHARQDVGCVQAGPLKIDVAATWDETRAFQDGWEARIAAEVGAIQARNPACVLSDISHLAIEAGKAAGKPTIALCNLSWDRVLARLADPGEAEQGRILKAIEASYGRADLLVRLTPGLAMPAFHKIVDVGPVARPVTGDRTEVAAAVGAPSNDRLVLVGFGGIGIEGLPFQQLDDMAGYQFLVAGPLPKGLRRSHPAQALGLPFGQLLAACDLLLTKPGYNMIVEAVALGKPVVYVRRYNFADEQSLVDYLHRHGRGIELSLGDFEAGRWQPALGTVGGLPEPASPPPPPTGAAEAAGILAGLL